MYILLMYYIFLLLLPPDGFVLCYIGLLVLTLWRFGDDVISPSPGKGRYSGHLLPPCLHTFLKALDLRGITRVDPRVKFMLELDRLKKNKTLDLETIIGNDKETLRRS